LKSLPSLDGRDQGRVKSDDLSTFSPPPLSSPVKGEEFFNSPIRVNPEKSPPVLWEGIFLSILRYNPSLLLRFPTFQVLYQT